MKRYNGIMSFEEAQEIVKTLYVQINKDDKRELNKTVEERYDAIKRGNIVKSATLKDKCNTSVAELIGKPVKSDEVQKTVMALERLVVYNSEQNLKQYLRK